MQPPSLPHLQPDLAPLPGAAAPRRGAPDSGGWSVARALPADVLPPRPLFERFASCAPALAAYGLECPPSCSCRGRGG